MKTVNGIVFVTADEMRQLDQKTIDGYSVEVLSLMENAGLQTALLAARMLDGEVRGKAAACLAGKGNNGGDGLVASRHLRDWGADVTVVLGTERRGITGIPETQLAALERTRVRMATVETPLKGYALLLDALLGYNAVGNPREPLASMIRAANSSGIKILAVDLPSGLDPTTGEPNEPCMRATATVTLGLPKTGFLSPAARAFVGELYLADISVPPEVYEEFSQAPGLFDKGGLVRIW